MSFYNFIYGINPEYKELLKTIRCMGSNLGIDAPEYTQIPRFRDIYYKNGVISILARIGGVEKLNYVREHNLIKQNKYYYRTIGYRTEDNYILFEFKYFPEKEFKRYYLASKIFIEDFFNHHMTLEQNELMASVTMKMQNGFKLDENELKRSPLNIKTVNIGAPLNGTTEKHVNVCIKKDLDKHNLNEYDGVIEYIDREDILNVVNINSDIRRRLK